MQESKNLRFAWNQEKRRAEIPFGWRRQKGSIITDDLEQWIMAKVKTDNKSGKSMDDIAKDLIRLGIKPRAGGQWFARRLIYTLIVNERLLDKLKEKGWLAAENLGEYMKKRMPTAGTKVSYCIKEIKEATEKSSAENEQRCNESGKIITQMLISAVKGKRQQQQLLGETSDAIQNRELCPRKHGRTSSAQGGVDRDPEASGPDVCQRKDGP